MIRVGGGGLCVMLHIYIPGTPLLCINSEVLRIRIVRYIPSFFSEFSCFLVLNVMLYVRFFFFEFVYVFFFVLNAMLYLCVCVCVYVFVCFFGGCCVILIHSCT